jgi:integrase
MGFRIDTKGGREALTVRNAEYWEPIRAGLYLGLRKGAKSSAWKGRYRLESGEQAYKTLGADRPGFSYAEARKALEVWATLLDQGVTGLDAAGEVATVASACRAYVKSLRVAKRTATARDNDMCFRRQVYGYAHVAAPGVRKEPSHPTHALAARELAKVTRNHLSDWRDELVDEAGSGLSPSAVNRAIGRLKAALNYAVETNLAPATLSTEAKFGLKRFESAGEPRKIYLDKKQRAKLLAAIDSPALRDVIEAAILTGARPGDFAELVRGDFDRKHKVATFRAKTKARTVPLSPDAFKLFERRAESKLPAAFMFTMDDGRKWESHEWAKPIREAAAKAGLELGVCLYTMRHCFITDALAGGMPPLDVARVTGTSLKMIDEHYGQFVNQTAAKHLASISML